jgi:hypothetical protein
MNRKTGELVPVVGLTPDEATKQGLLLVPPDQVERLMAMTPEERVEWARAQELRTTLPNGAELVRNVGKLMERGEAFQKDRNRRKRERRARRGK